MAKKRKLQVFVSSTFTDLKEERQSAVEAILNTGHIPAGMELFAGQNVEQMNIIKEWIEESDIYMLLLGGRYGSVEPTSGKSYTHLEYEHAQSLGKPVFAVIASDLYVNQRATANGKPDGIIELDYRKQYSDFKREITGRFVKFWDNQDQLKLAITTTLHVLERDESLVGWLPGSEVANTAPLVEELSRLAKEAERLRAENDRLKEKTYSPSVSSSFNGLSFDQTMHYLVNYEVDSSLIREKYWDALYEISRLVYSTRSPHVIHLLLLWHLYDSSAEIRIGEKHRDIIDIFSPLAEVGIIHDNRVETLGHSTPTVVQFYHIYNVVGTGRSFLLQLKANNNIVRIKNTVEHLRSQIKNRVFSPFIMK